jgi:hypothetical protein
MAERTGPTKPWQVIENTPVFAQLVSAVPQKYPQERAALGSSPRSSMVGAAPENGAGSETAGEGYSIWAAWSSLRSSLPNARSVRQVQIPVVEISGSG